MADGAKAPRPHWAYLLLLGLTPGILGVMFMVSVNQWSGLNDAVVGLRTDMAVVKNTLQGLMDRDIPTRSEVRAWVDQVKSDVARVDGVQRGIDERLRALERSK